MPLCKVPRDDERAPRHTPRRLNAPCQRHRAVPKPLVDWTHSVDGLSTRRSCTEYCSPALNVAGSATAAPSRAAWKAPFFGARLGPSDTHGVSQGETPLFTAAMCTARLQATRRRSNVSPSRRGNETVPPAASSTCRESSTRAPAALPRQRRRERTQRRGDRAESASPHHTLPRPPRRQLRADEL